MLLKLSGQAHDKAHSLKAASKTMVMYIENYCFLISVICGFICEMHLLYTKACVWTRNKKFLFLEKVDTNPLASSCLCQQLTKKKKTLKISVLARKKLANSICQKNCFIRALMSFPHLEFQL